MINKEKNQQLVTIIIEKQEFTFKQKEEIKKKERELTSS